MEPSKAPEAISKAVASLPPEQMFELMKQMKVISIHIPLQSSTFPIILHRNAKVLCKHIFPCDNFTKNMLCCFNCVTLDLKKKIVLFSMMVEIVCL